MPVDIWVAVAGVVVPLGVGFGAIHWRISTTQSRLAAIIERHEKDHANHYEKTEEHSRMLSEHKTRLAVHDHRLRGSDD